VSTLPVRAEVVPVKDVSFSTVRNVQRVDFDILHVFVSSPTRVEVRDVALTGTPVAVPAPRLRDGLPKLVGQHRRAR